MHQVMLHVSRALRERSTLNGRGLGRTRQPASFRRTAALFVALLVSFSSRAQLTPERLYYGVGRPIPILVESPANAADVQIELIDPASGAVRAAAPVRAGRVDLSALFPLWTARDGKVLYAQLVTGGVRIGSPLVLQPLLDTGVCRIDPDTKRPVWEYPDGKTYSGLRVYADAHVIVDTDKGDIEFRLRPDAAPNTAWNFLDLARAGFYTDIPIHRIVAKLKSGEPFVIQFGDPTGTGDGGPGYQIDLENSSLPHDFGVLSMARSADPNTNGSQVFIALSRAGTAILDGRYASFAEAIGGEDAIRALAAVPVIGGDGKDKDRPVVIPTVVRARVVPAPPFGQAPKPLSEQVRARDIPAPNVPAQKGP